LDASADNYYDVVLALAVFALWRKVAVIWNESKPVFDGTFQVKECAWPCNQAQAMVVVFLL